MKIVMAHNFYQLAGGEDAVFRAEIENLRKGGHSVFPLSRDNAEISGIFAKVARIPQTTYDPKSYDAMVDMIRLWQPDVVHVHNFFPLLSLSVHKAAHDHGVPVVQTLHNFRLLCAGGSFFRNGVVCEQCLGTSGMPAVIHGCYRQSRLGSLPVVYMQNRARDLFLRDGIIARFIALTSFAKNKMVSGGYSSEMISVKPNFVEPVRAIRAADPRGFLYVGRLTIEKGVEDLVRAWSLVDGEPLTIIGTGPDEAYVRALARPNVTFKGQLAPAEVRSEMLKAKALILPSRWFEGFPMVIVEALAAGLPVLASRIGSLEEIIDSEFTGLHFTPNSPAEITATVHRFLAMDQAQMSANATATYQANYTPEVNLSQQIAIYEAAIEARRS